MTTQTSNFNSLNAAALHNGRPLFGGNATLLEKKGLGVMRQSTPDSEVIEHSDDEHDGQGNMSLSMHSTKSVPSNNVQRRPSWMSEVQSVKQQRKFSVGGASHASSGSQPTTPLGENGPWDASNSARSGNGNTAHIWSSQIWSTKDRPTRLHEVVHSPTSSFHEDIRSPTSFSGNGLPFEIPLEPNRKTIRSQSYSAGQLEGALGAEHVQNHGTYRTRPIAHRPSRPSMLGDGQRDLLGALREDDDDDTEGSSGSDLGYPLRTTTSLQSTVRGTTFAPLGKVSSPLASSNSSKHQPRTMHPLSPSSENAMTDEGDDRNDEFSDVGRAMARGLVGSNASSATNMQALATSNQNQQTNGGLRKSQWQTSLGFDVLEEGSQSRRHSFAAEQLPSRTRHNSMAAAVENNQYLRYHPYAGVEPVFSSHPAGPHGSYQPGLNHDSERKFPPNHDRIYDSLLRIGDGATRQNSQVQMNDGKFADSYFHGMENHRRNIQDAADGYNPFALPNVFSRPQRILYLVVFKCSRADIYYIPENTGLQVSVGDTVIVEGDRGQDLGTIEAVNVTMEQAKQLKQDYLRKHYKCLMMFSRMYPHVVVCANDSEIFEAAIENSKKIQQQQQPITPVPGHGHGVAGGVGNAGQGPYHEAEPRPKMIKRVARPDEVHLLREKEGNEAKAKRVCQGKVHDHGLRMEILDAEFQHDYRKLTFYFYAEEYTNFNELVTDLFKVYKTRIWMSAINPTSFHGGGNPHTGQRQALWPKQGNVGNALSLAQPPTDIVRAHSPPEGDGPAARGDREYQRLFGNTPSGNSMSTGGFPSTEGYKAPAAPTYEPRSGTMPFSPTAHQFTPFASQFGAAVPGQNPWASMASQMPQAYQFADASNFESGLPATGTHGMLPSSQQSNSFSPRVGIGRGQFPLYNGRQHAGSYGLSAQPGAASYIPATNGQRLPVSNGLHDHSINTLDDQFNQFSINPRPLQ